MTEFWEANFRDKQEMWGDKPADAAIATVELFKKHGLNKILIPGFGYGRNAKIFTDNGLNVTGIEISKTAIVLAKKHYGDNLKVHYGPVSNMPFDQETYDGIFCYALIHLLDENERKKLIKDCYNQLRTNGYMVFTAISTHDNSYGKGEFLSKNRYLMEHGAKLFFYSPGSITDEFGKYGLIESKEVEESAKPMGNRPSHIFWQVVCKKETIPR